MEFIDAISANFLNEKQNQLADRVNMEKILGNEAYQAKDYEKSIKHYNNAMNIDDKNMVILSNLSAVYFQKKDNWRCADYCLKALLTAEDKEPSFKITLKCCLRLATAFKAVGDFKAAQEYYKKANNFQEADKLELELLKVKADDKTVIKSLGKKEYATGCNDSSLMCYTKALQIGEWGKSDVKLFLKRAAIFTRMNFFWLGLTDCKKGLLLNSNSDRLVLRRGILFHKLDIFYAALKDFQMYLSSHPNNETIKSYVKNIEEIVKKKQPRFQPKLPQFFEEYREMFPNDTLGVDLLRSHFTEFSCRAILIQSNPSIVDYLANKMHNNYQNEQFTIQRFGTPVLDPHFLNYWKKLPIGNVFPTIQDGGSPFTNRFQSMKNVNFPNYPLFYGKNHVSVGCVDFSELLFAQINGTEKDGCLNFAGVDCAVCSIARCWILKKMIENNSNCRSILQVWFSSAWSNQTHQEFVEACEILLKESTLDQELLYFIQLWKDSYLSVTEAANRWSLAHKSRCETALYEDLANMRYKIDRAEYARYLFTGFIFEEAESDLHCGNSTMFSVSKTNVQVKVEKENFYFFFNFSDNRFSYNSSLKLSMETFMLERMEKLQHLILAKQINIEFKCGQVSATNNELLEYVKSKNPHTIDWSNLMDYFTRDDFIKMSKHVAVTETVHYFHVMNWIKYVKGALIIDYDLKSKKTVIGTSLNKFLSRYLGSRILSSNFAQIWDYQVNAFSIINVTTEELCLTYIEKFLEHYFKDVAEFKIFGEIGQLNQSQTTCFGRFTIE